MRNNRLYLYELIEQEIRDDVVFTKPLINGKYLEYPYARITVLAPNGDKCTADCQRYNDQWMSIFSGTLAECIAHMESDDGWF